MANDKQTEKRFAFICAAWRRRLEGPMQARRVLVNRCDLPDGHEGKHSDNVLLVSWADSETEPESRPRNELMDGPGVGGYTPVRGTGC